MAELFHSYLKVAIFSTGLLFITSWEGRGQVARLLPDSIKTVVPDTVKMDEEISVGYATGNQRTISGSVDKVSEKRMNKGFVSNPLNALSGQSAGVSISPGTNRAAALTSVRVRGTTSLTGGHYRRGFFRFEYA